MADKILNSFDVWITAQGLKSKGRLRSIDNISLEGIARLRELILKFGLQGRLVNQDTNDEPARELLERIANENRTQAESKKAKDFPAINDGEVLFLKPIGWEWVRLQQIISISSGDGLTSAKMESEGDIPVFGGNGINGYHTKANITKPTLVIGRVGYYCGSVHVTPQLAWVTDNAFITKFSESNIDLKFLFWLLKGTNLKENDSATAQPVISGRKIYPIVVGLPPLNEQRRIVAKVDELMALCDELELEETNHLKSHRLLVETLLRTLTNAADATHFQQAWSKLEEHFDDLFTTEDSIDQLKQTILQLAVMGKLVPQDPNDEPARELLKRIKKEKEKLMKEGKIKKVKQLSELEPDEKPFQLPKGWEWCRFGELGEFINGDRSSNYPHTSEYVETGIAWINTGHIEKDGTLSVHSMNFITEEKYNSLKGGKILPDDLVYCLRGATFGKTAFVHPYRKGAIASSLMIIRLYKLLNSRYVFHYLKSPLAKQQLERFDNGSAQPNLAANDVSLYSFPIPPIDMQNRIVAKVDKLFALCDRLKERIVESQKVANQMTKAVVNNIN